MVIFFVIICIGFLMNGKLVRAKSVWWCSHCRIHRYVATPLSLSGSGEMDRRLSVCLYFFLLLLLEERNVHYSENTHKFEIGNIIVTGKKMEKEFPLMFRYLPVMKEFMTMGSVRLGEMEDLFTDMKSRVRRGLRVRFQFTGLSRTVPETFVG